MTFNPGSQRRLTPQRGVHSRQSPRASRAFRLRGLRAADSPVRPWDADRHLDDQLVRREAMERLKPWGASPDDLADELTDPHTVRQLELINASTATWACR